MTKFIPEIVSNQEEFTKALQTEPHVIAVIDKSLFKIIQANTKVSQNEVKTNIKKRNIAIATLAGSLFLPSALITMPVAIAGIALSGFGILRNNNEIKSNILSKYEQLDLDNDEFMILIKAKGKNTFNTSKDIIDFESLEK